MDVDSVVRREREWYEFFQFAERVIQCWRGRWQRSFDTNLRSDVDLLHAQLRHRIDDVRHVYHYRRPTDHHVVNRIQPYGRVRIHYFGRDKFHGGYDAVP
jgi:hypothetical protein